MNGFSDILFLLKRGEDLSAETMTRAMQSIMDGAVSEPDMAEFLTFLSQKGETPVEIAAAARVMRERAATISSPPGTVDCCGTGGDGVGTYNISTAVALVAAACGVPVAKHGNRASSSKSGTADVLEALGVPLDVPLERLERALREINFAFLMAPAHHAAMRHIVPVRKKLGFRTIFNLLGPLANPAGAEVQLIGVYDRRWLRPMAETLSHLGAKAAWVVHGHDGLDEITVTAPTDTARLEKRDITEPRLTPADFGLSVAAIEDLKGGDAVYNAAALTRLLAGERSAYRDIVLANTAAVLHLAGRVPSLRAGVAVAMESIDENRAASLLATYKEMVRG